MKLLRSIVILLFLVGIVDAAPVIRTVAQFNTRLRERVRVQSTVMISDSTVTWASREAVLYTSVTIGGCESNLRIVTAANDPYYPLPDTLVRILYASIQGASGSTFPLKAWFPQYYDIFDLDQLGDASENAVPNAFMYWKDTLQLMPRPTKIDTLLLRCFVEHPAIPNTTDSIRLRPAYTEAALEWASFLVFRELGLWEEATACLGTFKQMKADLEAAYSRKFDLPLKEQP